MRPLTDEDRALLQKMVDSIHRQFVRDVAQARKLGQPRVAALADGRLLTGERAKAAKLVDQLGNFSDALELAAKRANAKGDPVPVYPPSGRGLLGRLLEDGIESLTQRVARELGGDSLHIEVRAPRLRP